MEARKGRKTIARGRPQAAGGEARPEAQADQKEPELLGARPRARKHITPPEPAERTNAQQLTEPTEAAEPEGSIKTLCTSRKKEANKPEKKASKSEERTWRTQDENM